MTKNTKNIEDSQLTIFKSNHPLAYRIRPKKIEDFIGQEEKNTLLTEYIKDSAPYSIILWGPPGSGKTSFSQVVKEGTKKDFISVSGASTSVAELREIITKAKITPNQIILFIDEIHRLAKNQQDVLLEPVEAGHMTLIGTTTENPHISISRALHSRVKVLELKPHTKENLYKLIQRALTHPDGCNNFKITDKAKDLLAISSNGDGRRLLFNLEEACKVSRGKVVDEILVKEVLKDTQLQIGQDAENYYNCISALQKSIRGSDPDAALYWLARLLAGDIDPLYVARRILVTAAEDIGLADNNALEIAVNAYHATQFLGLPEARIPLAQAVIYLALAPKSNTTIVSIDNAIKDATELTPYPVPLHLRNVGGEGYKYPHSYKDAKVEQDYLPKELSGRKYFKSNERDKIYLC